MPSPEDLGRSVIQYVDDAVHLQHNGEQSAAIRKYVRAAEQALAIAVLMASNDQLAQDILEKARYTVSDQRGKLLAHMGIVY